MFGSKVCRLAATVAGIGVGLGLVATPAMASATAYNEVTEYLTASPNSGMTPTCHTRSIALTAGTYYWAQELTPAARNIILMAGTYSWQVCLYPHNGYYEETSSLTPSSGATATLDYHPIYLASSGTYTWGDELVPPS